MRKYLLTILLTFNLISSASAEIIVTYTEYGVNSEVNYLNLNGNFNNIRNVVNGSLDNDNTASGFEFVEVLSALPVAGTQGRIVYNTTDDTINADNGTAWVTAPTYAGTAAQGELLYFDGTNWARLGVGTAGNTLKTGGAAANPSWAALNLAGGSAYVTGITPTGNGGTGSSANANAANGVCVLDATGNVDTDLVDAGSIEANAVGTSEIAQNGVDNDEIAASAVKQGELNTTTGTVVSTSATYVDSVYPGGSYAFYPQFKMNADNKDFSAVFGLDYTLSQTYVTCIGLKSDDGSTEVTAQSRYITSSGDEHWVFLLYDNVLDKTISAWEAPDHPCYGQGGDENDIPHPFIKYFHEPLPPNLEIILLDNDKLDNIMKKTTRNEDILAVISEEYEVDETSTPTYEAREIIEIDEWDDREGEVLKTYKMKKNGKIPKLKKRMVDTLHPDITYRKLKKK